MFDVAVVGTGTMGSATAYELTKRGLKVIAFEQFRIVHDMGSHSGNTRIIRHAYHESPDYVPLVLRSDELWQQMEQKKGSQLLFRTGGVDFGPRDGTIVQNALLACSEHRLPHEHLSGSELMRRWPQFRVPEEWHACFDPNMGFLLVNDCIRAYTESAKDGGTEIHEEEPVLDFRSGQDITIKTAKGEYKAGHAVFCAGAWTAKLLRALELPLIVKRKTLSWLRVLSTEEFQVGRFPIFLCDTSAGALYGFPLYQNDGLKVANHHGLGTAVDPDTVNREFQPGDASDAQAFAKSHLRGVTSEIVDGKVCLYTMTPDEHFLIDFHPDHPNVVMATGFSGHGFKFAPAIGEILADLVVNRHTGHPIARFRLSRFF
jgi:monomeric sarcosine oxidase